MKVIEFIEVLNLNKGKALKFLYKQNAFVAANYHLTEIKNVLFETTDCGGKRNTWEETHFQLWENPEEAGKVDFMTTDKILSIVTKVDGINPLKKSTELKMEYGNEGFNTGVMPVQDIEIYQDEVIVKLFEEAARCKANDVCGILDAEVVEEKKEACCTTDACCS